MPPVQCNELGFYGLAGAPESPRDLVAEVRDAEALGIGACWLSERFNIKEIATISGVAGAVSEQIGIATGVTNHNTRHPLVTAGFGSTMHRLTGGRFTLGLGRGVPTRWARLGLDPVTNRQLEDFCGLLRRLWRGEVIQQHDGPAGRYPHLVLDATFDENIPLAFSAFGPKSLALGGRIFDAVLLHTFFADETLVRCIRTVRDAAEAAGRDPASVRVWSCFATIGDHLAEPVRLKKTVGRMATYLQAYGDLMVETNGWDPAVLARFRADPLVASFRAAIDDKATRDQLEHIATLIPQSWLAAAATGTPEQCARAVLGQLDLGADGVIMHGAAPADLAPIVEAYRELRPAGRFDALPANPGAPVA